MSDEQIHLSKGIPKNGNARIKNKLNAIKEYKFVTIAFFNSDIINEFESKSDGNMMSTIRFPNGSEYAGYIWYYPSSLIYSNEDNRTSDIFTFHPSVRWVKLNREETINILKPVIDPNTKQWEYSDEQILSAFELKNYMIQRRKNYKRKGD